MREPCKAEMHPNGGTTDDTALALQSIGGFTTLQLMPSSLRLPPRAAPLRRKHGGCARDDSGNPTISGSQARVQKGQSV